MVLDYNLATSELQLQPKNLRHSTVCKFSLTMKIDQAWVYQGNKMPEEIKIASTLASFKLLLKWTIHYPELLIPCTVVEGWSLSHAAHTGREVEYTMDRPISGHRSGLRSVQHKYRLNAKFALMPYTYNPRKKQKQKSSAVPSLSVHFIKRVFRTSDSNLYRTAVWDDIGIQQYLLSAPPVLNLSLLVKLHTYILFQSSEYKCVLPLEK